MAGVCMLGDKAKTENHTHGGPCCEHTCIGPAVSASANVFINGKPALRVGDVGIHAACCDKGTWQVIEGSGTVFINGISAVRKGDKTLHCGISIGHMVEASANVSIFDSITKVVAGPALDSSLLVFYEPELHMGINLGSEIIYMPPGVDLDGNIDQALGKRWRNPYLWPPVPLPIQMLSNIKNLLWFYKKVRGGGDWDYKNKSYPNFSSPAWKRRLEDFGNFHYGVVGAAAGIDEERLLRMAGWAHKHQGAGKGSGDPGLGRGKVPEALTALAEIGGKKGYGDDPRDQRMIRLGIAWYKKHHSG